MAAASAKVDFPAHVADVGEGGQALVDIVGGESAGCLLGERVDGHLDRTTIVGRDLNYHRGVGHFDRQRPFPAAADVPVGQTLLVYS